MESNKPWLQHYGNTIPVEVEVDQYSSVVEMLDEKFKQFSTLPAFSNLGKTLTFREVDQLSDAFGAYLQSIGLEKGDRIALMMPNTLQYPIALFGAFKAGLVVVNTNPLYTPREMEYQFTNSGAKAIVILENFAFKLQKIVQNTEIKHVITTSIGEMLPAVKKMITNFVVRNVRKMVPAYKIEGSVTLGKALALGKSAKLNKHKGTSEEVILLQYTGGTTGRAKGAMLTNRNMIANMLQVKAFMEPYVTVGKEVMLAPLPMYHIYAFTVNTMLPINTGFHSVLITNPRDLSTIVKAFKDYPISIMTGLNTLYNALANLPDFQQLDFSKLRICSAGGMALQRPVLEKWKAVTGNTICEGYGMTEASPVVSTNLYEDGKNQIGTIGIPVPSTILRVVDSDGNPLGPNEAGEIQVKGPQVMKGYYNRPEATASTVVDGWLNTGDIGEMTEDGYFKIVDRKKDMVLVSGFNVYPNEIEEVVAGHPKVNEAAVIGVPHPRTGEAVKLFIVKKETSLTKEEIISYCRENLTAYKVPKIVEFREDLPKSTVGKILRKNLREPVATEN